MSEQSSKPKWHNLLPRVTAQLIKVMHGALETAVTHSAKDGINVIAEYFEEAGTDDVESRRLLDMWWEKQK